VAAWATWKGQGRGVCLLNCAAGDLASADKPGQQEPDHESRVPHAAQPHGHGVGDGFLVRSRFSHDEQPERFLLLLMPDHTGPWRFDPRSAPRPGSAPAAGVETVPIGDHGEVAQRWVNLPERDKVALTGFTKAPPQPKRPRLNC
jgi:hypothetical protein